MAIAKLLIPVFLASNFITESSDLLYGCESPTRPAFSGNWISQSRQFGADSSQQTTFAGILSQVSIGESGSPQIPNNVSGAPRLLSSGAGLPRDVVVSPSMLTSPDQVKRLDDFVTKMMSCRRVPGLTLSVVVGDQAVMARHYGLANVEQNRPVTDDTIFCVASLTKAFTVTLLAVLLERHGYTWDVKVRDVIGEDFRLYDAYTSSHVTLRDLLLHRTGVPRYDLLWFSGKMSRRDLLSHMENLVPTEEFRSETIYNNIMYMLAGHVAENIGGKSWEALIQENILTPMGMNHTTFFHARGNLSQSFAKQYALYNGHNIALDAEKFMSGISAVSPAIALCSTATDMTRWILFIQSKGFYNNGRLVEYPHLMHEAFQPQVLATEIFYSFIQRPRTPVTFTLNTYGLAWLNGYYRGFPIAGHHGAFPGYLSLISMLPIYKIGIFSSINGGNQLTSHTINSLIHTYILDLLMGETPWIEQRLFQEPEQEACNFPNEEEVDFSILIPLNKSVELWRELNTYTGKYTSCVYQDIDVWIQSRNEQPSGDNDVPTLRMQYGLLNFTLYPVQAQGDIDIFTAEADHQDWMMPVIDVHFLLGPSNRSRDNYAQTDRLVVNSLQLPILTSEPTANHFVKSAEYDTRDELDNLSRQAIEPSTDKSSYVSDSSEPAKLSPIIARLYLVCVVWCSCGMYF